MSNVSVISVAKAQVRTLDLADLLCGPCQMRRVGDRWVARCPLPDHDERTPSFVVYPGDRGWWCYGCSRGGDVVDLARLAWDHPDDGRGVAEAAAYLLMAFGHEVPQRPPTWFARQERQKPVRDAIEEVKGNIVRRRLFKHLILPLIDTIKDEKEHDRELDRAWSEFQRLLS